MPSQSTASQKMSQAAKDLGTLVVDYFALFEVFTDYVLLDQKFKPLYEHRAKAILGRLYKATKEVDGSDGKSEDFLNLYKNVILHGISTTYNIRQAHNPTRFVESWYLAHNPATLDFELHYRTCGPEHWSDVFKLDRIDTYDHKALMAHSREQELLLINFSKD